MLYNITRKCMLSVYKWVYERTSFPINSSGVATVFYEQGPVGKATAP